MNLSPDKIHIREMTTGDIPAVFDIDKRSASLYWPESSYHFEVERNTASHPLVAADPNGAILGFIVIWRILDEAEIANFAVSPEHRNEGIGAALLREGLRICSEEGAKSAYLEVRAGNAPAIHLYEKTGFMPDGIRKHYYQDNKEDAILMKLEIMDRLSENKKGKTNE